MVKTQDKMLKKCKICGKEFSCYHPSSKYCGNKCRLKVSLKAAREYRYKNRKEIYKKQKNDPRIQEYMKEYLRMYMNTYIKKRYKEDKSFRTQMNLRKLVYNAISKYSKEGKIMKSRQYGINYKKIIEHLKPFPEEISKYDIDHILPLSKFNLNDKSHIKIAFHPFNHQWMLSGKNKRKSNEINSKKYPEQKIAFDGICNDLGITRNIFKVK